MAPDTAAVRCETCGLDLQSGHDCPTTRAIAAPVPPPPRPDEHLIGVMEKRATDEHSPLAWLRWRLTTTRCHRCRVRVLRSTALRYATVYGDVVRYCAECWKHCNKPAEYVGPHKRKGARSTSW